MKRSELLASIADPPWRAENIAEALGCSNKVAIRMMKKHPKVFYMPQREGARGERPRPLLAAEDAIALVARVRRGERV